MRNRIMWLMLLLALPCSLFALPEQELGKWWKNSEIVRRLQLSEGQIDQLEKVFLNYRQELASYNEDLKNQELQLKTLMQSEHPDDAQILAQSEHVAQARASLEKVQAAMMLAMRKELTKEQWTRLEEIREVRFETIVAGMSSDSGAAEEGVHAVKGVVRPKIIYQVMPSYTDEARAKKIQGLILFEVFVRKDGTVGDVKVLKGLGYGLDESAIRTITKDWRFEPGTLNGQPVDVKVNIEVSFRLY